MRASSGPSLGRNMCIKDFNAVDPVTDMTESKTDFILADVVNQRRRIVKG